jgi:hypothetical protein
VRREGLRRIFIVEYFRLGYNEKRDISI